MEPRDLEQVLVIESQTFRSPHGRQILSEELGREWAYVDVAKSRVSSDVVAYINYWLVRDEVHLLGLATHPSQRRNGFARVLLERMILFANERRCRYVTLEVRKSNGAAIALYEAYGFEAVGVRPNYYVEDREDALVMLLELEVK